MMPCQALNGEPAGQRGVSVCSRPWRRQANVTRSGGCGRNLVKIGKVTLDFSQDGDKQPDAPRAGVT